MFIKQIKKLIYEKKAFSPSKTVHYHVQIKIRPGQSHKSSEVFIPLPRQTVYQERDKLVFKQNPGKIIKDELENEIAYWKLTNQEEVVLEVASEVSIKPKFEKIAGNLADYIKKEEKSYLESNKFFNYEDSRIRDLAVKLKGSSEEIATISQKFYDYVVGKLTYGGQIEGLYSSIEALEKSQVDCGGFASLLGALYRCVGIPARLVAGYLVGYSGLHMHAWLEFMLPSGVWVPADPSVENLRSVGRDFKPGGFAKIGNDHLEISKGEDFNILGKRFDLLQNPVVFSEPEGSVQIEKKITFTNGN